MDELFTVGNLFTFLTLTLLQAVLGFDNLLYVSLESKRVTAERQAYVRKMGIGLAIGFRIVLLFVVVKAIAWLQDTLFSVGSLGIEGNFSGHSLIVLGGGAFIIYTAFKEILHMLAIDDLGAQHNAAQRTVGMALFWIVLMNLVFSFDSILSAIALTGEGTDDFIVMAVAIVGSGILMIVMADRVASFLQKNRMFEVLGLFVLFLVGVMLLSEGAHLAHLKLFGHEVHAMSKATFYFVLAVLVVIDLVQSRYRRKLERVRAYEMEQAAKGGSVPPGSVTAG